MDGADKQQRQHLLGLEDSDFEVQTVSKRCTHHRGLWGWTLANAAISIFAVAVVFYHHVPTSTGMNYLLKQTSVYSPVLESVDIQTFVAEVDGALVAAKKPSIARLPPGPEANAAWHRFETIRTVPITAADVRAMGKDPETAAQFPADQWSDLGPEPVYMGQLDIVHQLHCLNQLRKVAFAGYGSEGGGSTHGHARPQWMWIHLQHCVSILLESLTCHADTELLTLNWIDEQDFPFPDFSVQRQCKDFEAILSWQEERAVSLERWNNMTKPRGGINIVPGESEWWKLPGVLGQDHHHGA